MKKFIFGLLILVSFSQFASGEEALPVKFLPASPFMRSLTKTYYIVHGGCRVYNQYKNLTEIWLYLSEVPGRNYEPDSNIRTTMFLDSDFKSVSSRFVCGYLRGARISQTPVDMWLAPYPGRPGSLIVKVVNSDQIGDVQSAADGLHGLFSDRSDLENFSVGEKAKR